MKKIITLIACLNIGVSSIAMGAALEVVDGGRYLSDVDQHSQVRLKPEGAFNRNQQRYLEDKSIFFMGRPVETIPVIPYADFIRPTTEIEFFGNISSGASAPIGGDKFQKTQGINDSMGKAHDVVFKFTRLAAGTDADNKVQYSVDISVAGGTIKRYDASGTALDSSGAPMTVTFNQNGQLNLFDYGLLLESDLAPNLYIEWTDPSINSEPLMTKLNLGRGKGMNPTAWTGTPDLSAEGNLTSYDGPSLITYSQQDGIKYGRFENIRIEEDGTVSAFFSNGRSFPIARLPMVTVARPNDSEFVPGNVFYETQKSGSIVLDEDRARLNQLNNMVDAIVSTNE